MASKKASASSKTCEEKRNVVFKIIEEKIESEMRIRRACVCVFLKVWHGKIDHKHFPKKNKQHQLKASDVAKEFSVLSK